MKELFRTIGTIATLGALALLLSIGIFRPEGITSVLAKAFAGKAQSAESIAASSSAPEVAETLPKNEQPTPPPTQLPETTKVNYRIDKNFNIVPIDENGNKKIVLLTIDDGPKESKTLDPIL